MMKKYLIAIVLMMCCTLGAQAESLKFISNAYTFCENEYNCTDVKARTIITMSTDTRTIIISGPKTFKLKIFNTFEDYDDGAVVFECTVGGSYIALRSYYDEDTKEIAFRIDLGATIIEFTDVTMTQGPPSKGTAKSGKSGKGKSRRR